MSLGSNIKIYRVDKSLSQEDLANLIGIHKNHISRYERDLASPSIEVVKKIAEAFGISIDRLVYGDRLVSSNDVSDTELVLLFNKVVQLSDKNKTTVKELISAFVLKQNIKTELS